MTRLPADLNQLFSPTTHHPSFWLSTLTHLLDLLRATLYYRFDYSLQLRYQIPSLQILKAMR